LTQAISGKVLSKDIMIIQLYCVFLGMEVSDEKNEFALQLSGFLRENKGNLLKAFEPETNFDFSKENIRKIKELLLKLKEGTIELTNNTSNIKLFDVFASIILEGLQCAQIIPYTAEAELDEISEEIAKFSSMKSFLSRIQQIIQI